VNKGLMGDCAVCSRIDFAVFMLAKASREVSE